MRENKRVGKWTALLIIGASPLTLLPFLNYPDSLTFTTESLDELLYFVGGFLGYVGIFLLLWQQIFGNRFIVKYFTKDLPWTVMIHRRMGIYGIFLLLLHPVLMTYTFGTNILFHIPVRLDDTFETYVAFGRLALFIIVFIWLSSFLLRAKLKYRPWKYIHYLSYIVLPLVFLHASQIGSQLDDSRGVQLIWDLLIAIWAWALALRIVHFIGIGQKKYSLIAKKELTPGVFQYVFEPNSKKALQPSPGQFIYIRQSYLGEEHPFTVADYDTKTGTITIISKVFGRYTSRLARMKLDKRILIDGPYGSFTSGMHHRRPAVLIAGGIGITPFLRHIFKDSNRHLFLFNCNRSIKNVVLRKELKNSLGNRYVDVISENSKGKNIETGYIDADLIRKYISKDLRKMDFYICGPPAMINATTQNLIDNGIPPQNIFSEKFSF